MKQEQSIIQAMLLLFDLFFNLCFQTLSKIPEALLELNVTWDQLHLMMTRSTTPDLIILYYKLLEFFEKQFTESKDYIKECELDLFYEMKVKQQCKLLCNLFFY